jgi:hypothetical protein
MEFLTVLKKYFLSPIRLHTYFLALITQTMHVHNSIAKFCLKKLLYTLAGTEPRSSVPQAAAMTTAPRCQGVILKVV